MIRISLFGIRRGIEMERSTDARKRFISVALRYNNRVTENFEAFITLAQRIYEAENIGFRIDPDSVEKALKNVLGVE